MALKMDFGCEIYALLKKHKRNQKSTWQVEVGTRGDTPPNNLTFTNKFLYEVTHFYKKKRGSLFTMKLLYKRKLHAK
jgi:hypothetical protein